jgi:predicted DNA-binding protein (UPF0251 family)
MTGPGQPPFNNANFRKGRGRGHRGMHHRGIGRPPISYPMNVNRSVLLDKGLIELSSFELQILQLSDIEGLTQEEIAEKLSVSQTSIWRYLKAIRLKIAETITKHDVIDVIIKK